MLLAIHLLTLAILVETRQESAVYVNNLDGSDSATCGTPSSPCQTLSTTLKKAQESAKVYATGTFYVKRAIKLSKNVTIIGNNQALILRRPDGRLEHVFKISSDIKVSFISLKIRRVGLVVTKESASILIFNCTFDGPTFKGSPSIHVVYLKTIHIKLNLTSTLFANKIQVPLKFRSKKPTKSTTNLIMINCTFNKTGVSTLFMVSNALIKDTIFYQNVGFMLHIYHGQIIRIQRCQFLRGAGFGLTIFGYSNYLKNKLIIADCVFTGQKTRLDISWVAKIDIKNCLFSKIRFDKLDSPVRIRDSRNIDILNMTCEGNKAMGTDGGCLRLTRGQGNLFVTIWRSTFIQNAADNGNGGAIYAKCDQRVKCTVKISETLFLENLANEGGSMFISNVNTLIKSCNFIKNRAVTSGAGLNARGTLRYFLLIEDSKFSGCYSSGQGGALVMIGQMDIKLQNSLFENNLARSGSGGVQVGAQFSLNSTVEIDQTSFTNCTAPSIYLYTFKIKLRNITLTVSNETSVPHIKLEGKDVSLRSIVTHSSYPKEIQSNIKDRVISAVSNILTTNELSVSCSPNFYVEVESFSLVRRRIEVSCQTCQTNMYTLSHELVLQQITNETVNNLPKCLDCPSGAVCDGHIKVLDNYWGTKIDNRLQVMPCPDGYCCSSQSNPCTSYDTCAGPRTGTLCGTCSSGYVQGYMTEGCVQKGKDEDCNQQIFVIYFVISSLAYTLCLTFLPTVLTMLREILMQCKRSSSKSCEKGETERTYPAISSVEVDEVGMNYAAYLTLVMFFFQIASVVNISLPSKRAVDNEPGNESEVKRTVFDIFNFHLSLRAKICPMENLAIIEKLFMNIGLKLSTLLHLVWILLIWKSVALVKSFIQGSYHSTNNTVLAMTDTNSPGTNEAQLILVENGSSAANNISKSKDLSFPFLVKIGLLKMIKLNFTSAVNLFLQLVHCERIGNQFHLYVYGDYICYSWWQILIFTLILPVFILLPVSFGVSLDLLKARKISTNWFLLSCGLPVPTLWFQLKKRLGHLQKQDFTNDEERCIEEILQLEEELFVSTDKGMRWPVVQLYRNLLIVILNIYILNREYKILWYIALFGAFAIHDKSRKPFKHPYLNTLQLLTSICLFVINLCNVPAAFSSYGDVLSVPQMNICVKVLKYIQYSLYALVPLSFPLWKMYQQYQRRMERSEDEKENLVTAD